MNLYNYRNFKIMRILKPKKKYHSEQPLMFAISPIRETREYVPKERKDALDYHFVVCGKMIDGKPHDLSHQTTDDLDDTINFIRSRDHGRYDYIEHYTRVEYYEKFGSMGLRK